MILAKSAQFFHITADHVARTTDKHYVLDAPPGNTRNRERPKTRRRDDLDIFVTLAPGRVKHRPVEDNGEGLCSTTDI